MSGLGSWRRLLRHLLWPDRWGLGGRPSAGELATIEAAIARNERGHRGELRFVVEGSLPVGRVLGGMSARDRALDLFALLHVWDTEDNSGVLIYVQQVDRCVEIVADRGIHRCVGADTWVDLCRQMERQFAAGRFEEGAVAALDAIGALLKQHFPAADASNPNELPDRPLVL